MDTPLENYILAEVVKSFYNERIAPPVFFWRDQTGHEIDLIIEESGALFPVEIKSGSTAAGDMFKGLTWWTHLAGRTANSPTFVYGGKPCPHHHRGHHRAFHSLLHG